MIAAYFQRLPTAYYPLPTTLLPANSGRQGGREDCEDIKSEIDMKICYIGNAGSIHTQRWVKYFADKGHEVYLISPRPFGDNIIENVKLYVLRRFHPQIRIISFAVNLLFNIIQARKLLRKVKPDILHVHGIGGAAFVAALIEFHPLVLNAWGSDVLVAPKNSRISK